MAARRLFTPRPYLAALPASQRLALYGFVSVLLGASRHVEDLYGDSLVVDVPRGELARTCGCSARTVRRHEELLAELGIVRLLVQTGNRRVLELVEPDFAASELSDRAVDSSVDNPLGRRSQVDTSVQLRWTPVSTSDRPSPYGCSESGKSRHARPHTTPSGSERQAQTATRCARGFEAEVARGILLAARQRLEEGATQSTRHARTLTARQAAECDDAIAKRLTALTRSGAGELAIDLTKRDVDRVVEYSLQAARPAAHLHRSLVGGKWNSAPAPGSVAEGVKARGPAAEMPQDRGVRDGPTWEAPGVATEAERERLVRALDATGTTGARRRLALGMTGSSEVVDLAWRLERAALQMAVAEDVAP